MPASKKSGKKRQTGKRSKTSPAAIERKEKVAEAIRMRSAGFDYSEIKKMLGFSTEAAAQAAVSRALDARVSDAVKEYRSIHLDRLEKAVFVIMQLVEQGDLDAVRELCRVLERQSRLLGLDARDVAALAEFRAQAEDRAAAGNSQIFINSINAVAPSNAAAADAAIERRASLDFADDETGEEELDVD